MSKKFYITTPIYYANANVHIGHAYCSFICDVIARTKRMLGYEVKFTSGTDENGEKMMEKAFEQGKDVLDFLDDISSLHYGVRKELKISLTDYVRTTDRTVENQDLKYAHHKFVHEVIKKCIDNGDVYKGKYEGLYCVGCEAFKKTSELTKDGLCPDHQKAPQTISEENYFFRLSKYEDRLKQLYKDQPDFVIPESRFAEIKKFVSDGLEDFSVSRKAKDFRIPFPLDEEHVVYIWFDALFSYMTVCQTSEEEKEFWPADLHVMAKEILKFHAIYWPAMLWSAGYDLPKKILCTGFWVVEGQKMSKSIGNVIDPIEVVEKFGRDVFLFYLIYDLNIGNDGDFNWDRFRGVYDAMLLGGRGNLVSRVTKISKKNGISRGKIYADKFEMLSEGSNNRLLNLIKNGYSEDELGYYLDNYNLNALFKDWYELVQLCNKFIDNQKPWEKLKNSDKDGIKDLEFLLFMIKQIGLLSAPFLIESFEKLQGILGNQEISAIDTIKTFEDIEGVWNMSEFQVELEPRFLYEKLEG